MSYGIGGQYEPHYDYYDVRFQYGVGFNENTEEKTHFDRLLSRTQTRYRRPPGEFTLRAAPVI